MPTGATTSTQSTIFSIACASSDSSRMIGLVSIGPSRAMRASATPSARPKITSGKIWPCAAAPIGFSGMIAISCAASPGTGCGGSAPIRPSSACAGIGQTCSTASTRIVDRITVTTMAIANTPSVVPIRRLPRPPATALATPCVIIAKISGTSVICNARTHICPTGSSACATSTSQAGPAQRTPTPANVPSTSAPRINRVRFTADRAPSGISFRRTCAAARPRFLPDNGAARAFRSPPRSPGRRDRPPRVRRRLHRRTAPAPP